MLRKIQIFDFVLCFFFLNKCQKARKEICLENIIKHPNLDCCLDTKGSDRSPLFFFNNGEKPLLTKQH